MRRLALALPLLALGLLPTAGHADPYVGRAGTAEASVQLRGTDNKAYTVTLSVSSLTPQGGTASYTLGISIAKCGDGACGTAKRYSMPLTSSQVKAEEDMSSVEVHVTVLGTALSVAWAADPMATPADGGVRVQSSVVQGDFNTTPRDATVKATLWGATCRASGTTSAPMTVAPEGLAAEGGPRPVSSAPPQFAKKAGRRVTCLG